MLRGLRVDQPNQVWCVDITYLTVRRSFLYLVAIMDWHTWMDRAWRISNTLDADFCVKALNETIYWFGPPGIMTAMTVPVHVIYLNRPAASVRHPHLDGRQGSLSGHHLH